MIKIVKIDIVHWFFVLATLVLFVGMIIGTVKYNNIVHATAVIVMTIFIIYMLMRTRKIGTCELKKKQYVIIMCMIFLFSLIANAAVIYNVPLPYYSDFIIAREQAIYMYDNFGIHPGYSDYYHAYPFNINTVVFIGLLYRLIGDYHLVELITATFVNVTAIFTGLTVHNITKNRILTVCVAMVYEFYSIFCMKTYMPYTSNLVMLFPILIVFVYTLRVSMFLRIILMSVIAFVGSTVKLTALIPFIGIMIVEGILWVKEKNNKYIVVAIISSICFYSITSLYVCAIKDSIGFSPDPTIEHNVVYYLAQGQNNDMGGQYNRFIAVLGDQHRPKAERDSLFWNMALGEFTSRSFMGHVKFFVSKIAICWGEVHQDNLSIGYCEKILLVIRHLFWFLALTLIFIGIFLFHDRKYYAMMLGVFGVVAYLYLSESGSRYVIMYSPIIFVMAAWVADKLNKIIII